MPLADLALIPAVTPSPLTAAMLEAALAGAGAIADLGGRHERARLTLKGARDFQTAADIA